MPSEVPAGVPATPPGIGRGEWLRKLVHIGAGGLAPLLRWLPPWAAWLMAGAALVVNAVVLPTATGHALERDGERRRGVAWGIVFYPLMVLALTLVFHRRLEIAAAGWCVMAFGDGLATLVGRRLPAPRLPWNRHKSVAGSLAFVVAGTLAAWSVYLFVAAGHGRHPDPWAALLQVGLATVLAALFESIPSGIDDNLSVPLVAAVFIFGLAWVEPALLAAAHLPERLVWGLAINLLLGGAAYMARAVHLSGFIGGVAVGLFIYLFGGPAAFAILMLFFVLGSAATRVGFADKAAAGIAQGRGGARGARNAMANCGAGAVLIFFAAATPAGALLMVAFVAAFATAAFDTLSSEIGQVYGRRTVLITTLRPVPRGTEGAVSLEGTLAGFLGSLVVGGAAVALGLIPAAALGPVAAGAFVGAMGESFLGATLEALQVVDNEMVNFLNTVVGGGVALALAHLFL